MVVPIVVPMLVSMIVLWLSHGWPVVALWLFRVCPVVVFRWLRRCSVSFPVVVPCFVPRLSFVLSRSVALDVPSFRGSPVIVLWLPRGYLVVVLCLSCGCPHVALW